jgi:hypothetical protein
MANPFSQPDLRPSPKALPFQRDGLRPNVRYLPAPSGATLLNKSPNDKPQPVGGEARR